MHTVKIFVLLEFYASQVGVQRHYGRAYRSHFHAKLFTVTLNSAPIRYPETSITNQTTLP